MSQTLAVRRMLTSQSRRQEKYRDDGQPTASISAQRSTADRCTVDKSKSPPILRIGAGGIFVEIRSRVTDRTIVRFIEQVGRWGENGDTLVCRRQVDLGNPLRCGNEAAPEVVAVLTTVASTSLRRSLPFFLPRRRRTIRSESRQRRCQRRQKRSSRRPVCRSS